MKGTYTRISKLTSLMPGDHVCIWDYHRPPFSYQHHGIIWKAGDSIENIEICHIWTPLDCVTAAIKDSFFRLTKLKYFISRHRRIEDLRLVEYHTSSMREILSRWGEVHYTKADLPPIVLARCRLILNYGRGEYNILSQNCEHIAHWCMTGELWSKQMLCMTREKVPFQDQIASKYINALEETINQIKQKSIRIMESFLDMSDVCVYLKVNGRYYVVYDKETKRIRLTAIAPLHVNQNKIRERSRALTNANNTVMENVRDLVQCIKNSEKEIISMEKAEAIDEDGTETTCNIDSYTRVASISHLFKKQSTEEEKKESWTTVPTLSHILDNEDMNNDDSRTRENQEKSKDDDSTLKYNVLYHHEPTLFQMTCYSKGYNCMKVTFQNVADQKHLYSSSLLSSKREVKLKNYTLIRGSHAMTWEYSPFYGFLKSMSQHRRYIGIDLSNGKLIDVSIRDMAAKFEFVVAPASQQKSTKLPEITRCVSGDIMDLVNIGLVEKQSSNNNSVLE